jgi:hypothetical protein
LGSAQRRGPGPLGEILIPCIFLILGLPGPPADGQAQLYYFETL